MTDVAKPSAEPLNHGVVDTLESVDTTSACRSRAPHALAPSCLVLDVTLRGLSGLELQKRSDATRIDMSIIFITGHGEAPMTVTVHEGRSRRVSDEAMYRRRSAAA